MILIKQSLLPADFSLPIIFKDNKSVILTDIIDHYYSLVDQII